MTKIEQWRAKKVVARPHPRRAPPWVGGFLLVVLTVAAATGILLFVGDGTSPQAHAAAPLPSETPPPTLTQPEAFTSTQLPSPTISLTPLPTATRRPPTLTPTASRTPAPIPTRYVSPTPVASVRIEDFVGRKQSLPLSCEASAAVDWAAYFHVSIDELNFQNQLPLSDNPNKGFVGNVEGAWGQVPPAAYGVYAEPVAQLLRAHGVPAWAVYNLSLEAIKAEIALGRPVIVWVIGHVGRGTPVPYVDADGYETVVARFEHTVVVTGYDASQVWIVDGARQYTRTLKEFLDSWGVLGNMAIIWRE